MLLKPEGEEENKKTKKYSEYEIVTNMSAIILTVSINHFKCKSLK